METIYKEISRLTKQSNTNVWKRLAKLTEEVGEVAEAISSSNGELGCTYKQKTKDDIIEELCDIIIVSLSMASLNKNIKLKDLITTINQKLIKWNNNIMIKEVNKNE